MTINQLKELTVEINNIETHPNGLKVSKTNNPFYFPAKYTYQVGSSEIVAMASNAIAVGTGQTGQAPLYVFCKDGIYALFVDASGEMAYTNSRIIARDVCNNAKSVTPIDAGVAFTTDRGLMMIAGEQVEEIGQPLEGDYYKVKTSGIRDNTEKVIGNCYGMQKIAGLPPESVMNADFLVFLKNAIINYNHNERELMVSNPTKNSSGKYLYPYTYILDRDGNWSRRDIVADEYVNNYPTSYRLEDGYLHQVDNESDADNGMFVMTRELKLDSIGFKELHRFVARGYFETVKNGTQDTYLTMLVFGSYDGRKFSLLGYNNKSGKFTDLGCKVERTDCKFFKMVLSGRLSKDSRLDYFEVGGENSALNSKIR